MVILHYEGKKLCLQLVLLLEIRTDVLGFRAILFIHSCIQSIH